MLLGLIDNTESDSFELFRGLYKFNKNSEFELQKVKNAFKHIYAELNDRKINQVDLGISENVLCIQESKTSQMLEMVLKKKRKG